MTIQPPKLTREEVERWVVDPKWDSTPWFCADMKTRVLALLEDRDRLREACERVAVALDEEKHSDGQGYWSPSLSGDDVRLLRAAIAESRRA